MARLESSRYLRRASDVYRYRDHSTFTPGAPSGGGAKPMLIGASQADWDNFNTELKAVGGKGMGIRRSYDNSMPATFSASAASGDPGRGCASYWSWSDRSQMSAVAAGTLNSTITGFLNSIPAGHTFYGTFWHEIDLYSSDYATYKAAWVKIRAAYNASTCDKTKVKLGGLLTTSGFRAGKGPSFFDSNHDFVGIDFYDFHRPPGSPNDPKTHSLANTHPPDYYVADAVTTAQALGIPIIVGENGYHPFNTAGNVLASTDPDSRPYRLNATIAYLDNLPAVGSGPGCLAYCYFHSGNGGSGPWWLNSFPVWATPNTQNDDDPDSVTAYRQIIANHAAYTGS